MPSNNFSLSKFLSNIGKLAFIATTALLVGCGTIFSTKSDNITLAPSVEVASNGVQSDRQTIISEQVAISSSGSSSDSNISSVTDNSIQPLKKEFSYTNKAKSVLSQLNKPVANSFKIQSIVRTAPGCKSKECPTISISLLSFDNKPRINSFLNHALAAMGEIESDGKPPHASLDGFERSFFGRAKQGYTVSLKSSVLRNSPEIVVIQLDSYIYQGGANGISATQYLNWLPLVDKLITLEAMILPDQNAAFETTLKQTYEDWLSSHSDSISDMTQFKKLWPFVVTDNVALVSNGLAVSYDPVRIAPHSFGTPTWVIPYDKLQGIIRPELMPK